VRPGVSLPPGVLTELSLRIDEPVRTRATWRSIGTCTACSASTARPPARRGVITAIAEGLDVQVATDHDTVADYTPALRRLGLERQLLGIAGVEFETVNGDHCAWPLVPAPSDPFGGARRWWLDGREVADMYRYYAERGAIVTSVAHGASHFASAGYDTATGAVADASRFSFDFNAMEVHNGGGSGGRSRLVPIWAPSWMTIEEVRLWANGTVIERWDATTEPAVERRAGRAVWFEHHVSVQPDQAPWYAVDASGSQDLAPVNPGSHPWALTAPLFIDTDGDSEVSLPR